MSLNLRGIISIPASPFDDANELDFESLRREVDFSIASGCVALLGPVVASEVWQLTKTERQKFNEVVVDQNNGRVPVLAGCSSTDADEVFENARAAVRTGANAVCAMLPNVEMNGNWDATRAFYAQLAEVAGVQVVIQTGGRGPDDRIPIEHLTRLVREIELVSFIKEEGNPSNHRISDLVDAKEPKLLGVIGGMGGRFMIDEMRRGATAFAPICTFTDVLVLIWNLFHAGQEEQAMDAHEKLSTILNIEFQVGMTFSKELLKRRGLLKTNHSRSQYCVPLDSFDFVEMERRLERLRPYMNRQ